MPQSSPCIATAPLPARQASSHTVRGGFTMIELLAVVAILGLLATLASPKLRLAVDKAKDVKAISDLKAMAVELANVDALPASLQSIGWADRLDPWGQPYVYVAFPAAPAAPPSGARIDRFSVPINTRYDLYSVGRDGGSTAALTAGSSLDDLIVANDGGFVGHARSY